MIRKIQTILVLAVLCFSTRAAAQVQVSHLEDWFFIEEGTPIIIQGTLTSLPDNARGIVNLSDLLITDSVICYGDNLVFGATPDTLTSSVQMIGDGHQNMGGPENIRFGNLYIQNSYDSLNATTDVSIFGHLRLDSGNIDYQNQTVDLMNTGRMSGETNEKRLYGDPYGKIHLRRPLISGNTYNDIAGTGLDLTIDGNLGSWTDVWRHNTEHPTVSNGSIDRAYFFDANNYGFVSNPGIHYMDSNEYNGQEEQHFSMYLSESAGVTWKNKFGTLDSTNDKVTTTDLQWMLTNNSMLTIAENDCQNPPELYFTRDTVALCGAASAWLHPNGITGMESEWSTGTANADSIQVSTAGTYSVMIVDLAGCPNEDSIVVVTQPLPVAAFTAAPQCVGTTTTVTNTSSITSGTVSYMWDFADVYTSVADTSSMTSPTHTYADQGTFTINLKVTSDWDCVDELSKNVIVLPYPEVSFTVAEQCEDSTLAIVNYTKVTPMAGLTYVWDFNGEGTSTDVVPSFDFTDYGNKNIKLTATSNGCTSVDSVMVRIHDNPISNFTSTDACFGDATVFVNTSTVNDDSLGYNWSFENGVQSPLVNPTYTFNQDGSNNVKLESYSSFGCMSETTLAVRVNALPTPDFNILAACENDSATFQNLSSATSSFAWDFNGVGASTQTNPKYAFANFGNKAVELVETDLNGCVDSITKTWNIKQRPSASFTFSDLCVDEPFTFQNTSNFSGTPTYKWSEANSTNSLTNYFVVFSSSGAKTLKLVVNDNGCEDSVSHTINVFSKPVVDFGSNIATCGTEFTLDAGNLGSTYQWSDYSSGQTLKVTQDGNYGVKVINTNGCEASDNVYVNLSAIVTVDLGEDATHCDGVTLDAGYPGSTYTWNTGATSRNLPTSTSGLYWVDVLDQNGCADRDSVNVNIVSTAKPTLGADLYGCVGDVFTLDPQLSGATYTWSTTATAATIGVNTSGQYSVETTDANGCKARDTVKVVVNANPMLNLGADGIVCDSTEIDVTQSGVTYLWNDAQLVAQRTIKTSGQYWVELTNATTNCKSRDTVQVTIAPNPIIELGNDTIICNATSVTFDADNAGSTFLWNQGTTTQQLEVSADGLYYVDVTSPQGCAASDSIRIEVRPPLSTYLGEDFVLCRGLTKELTSPVANGTYVWSFNGTAFPSTIEFITADTIGKYSVVVTDNFNCVATDTIESIETQDIINADFLVSTLDLYEGDTIQFVNTSFPTPFNSSWKFGDGNFSINEDPTHVYFKEGDYKVELTAAGDICSHTVSKFLTINPLSAKRPDADSTVWVPNDLEEVLLFPNPNTGDFTLRATLAKEGSLNVSLLDLTGKEYFSETLEGQDIEKVYHFPELATGFYFLNLRVNERIKTIKFIKQ